MGLLLENREYLPFFSENRKTRFRRTCQKTPFWDKLYVTAASETPRQTDVLTPGQVITLDFP